MKLGIITMHYIQNYGSILQSYATQKILEKLGCEVEIIDFWRADWIEENIIKERLLNSDIWNKNAITRALFRMFQIPPLRKSCRLFEGFLQRHLNLSKQRYFSLEDLEANVPQADIYCTGSDQVWNGELNRGTLLPNYLVFAPEGKKRIAFSASFGKEKLGEVEKAETKALLEKYSAISVRERSGLDILEDLGIYNAVHVLDPTLVLTGEDWRKFAAPQPTKRKYALLYQLNIDDKDFNAAIRAFAKRTGLRLIRMNGEPSHIFKPGKLIRGATMEEFVSWVLHAEFILTDSFHMTAFSVNLNRPFASFYPISYSARIDSLLHLTGLMDRRVKNCDDILHIPLTVDFSNANRALFREREKAQAFLLSSIQNQQEIHT